MMLTITEFCFSCFGLATGGPWDVPLRTGKRMIIADKLQQLSNCMTAYYSRKNYTHRTQA
jgi:hypothetical protein